MTRDTPPLTDAVLAEWSDLKDELPRHFGHMQKIKMLAREVIRLRAEAEAEGGRATVKLTTMRM